MKSLFILGDSTAAHKDADKRPETGWGMMIADFLPDGWEVINLAKNGRSTKSFLQEGLFSLCIEQLKADDFVLIQFGHNDSKEDEPRHTEAYTTYLANLYDMAEAVLSKNAHVVLTTPICRRRFSGNGTLVQTHGEYPSAMMALAATRGYPLLDMTSRTFTLLSQLGSVDSKQLFLHLKSGEHPNYPEGIEDDTHLCEKGARRIAEMVFKGLKELGLGV